MSAPANPYAFPAPDDDRPSDGYGMELRDYFAGQSISGCRPGSQVCDQSVQDYADWAYRMADAMLVARGKANP